MPDSPDDASLQQLVMRVAHESRRRWIAELEPYGLSPHLGRALGVVARDESGAGPRLSELADRLHVTRRSATEVVDGLAERGLVERRADPDDRRAAVVVLTGAGRALWETLEAARLQRHDAVFAGLTDPDRAELRRILTVVIAGLG